ncbi:serine/threonine-protein kinase sck1 [Coniochaeta sp. 2T2.1]|nr:serine/threonine-protein kinase sck1 [Coniochaeta sp. 2T2.1]
MSGTAEGTAAAPPPPHGHGTGSNSGGFDLLKRATQRMMSKDSPRSAAGDDDGTDNLGFETPRSGVATPQPDLHDKRLPGIMSYFGQVRPASFSHFFSKALGKKDSARFETAAPRPNTSATTIPVEPTSRSSPRESGIPHSLSYEMVASCCTEEGPQPVVPEQPDPYPTPPASHRSSLHTSPSGSGVGQGVHVLDNMSRQSLGPRQMSDWILVKGHARAFSLLTPLPSMVTESSASALHISNPGTRAATVPGSPTRSYSTSGLQDPPPSPELASVKELKRLTSMTRIKSGTSTPTRALSVAAPSQSDPKQDDANRATGEDPQRAATHTPTPTGVQAPAARGKLTIKVPEARGLRKCRDPYVIVVFQRTELISSGSQQPLEDDDAAIQHVAMGGLPIQRQGSDSGRPAMAIPMRSRQSSNTSISDYTTFRNRNTRRSLTNPKWEAEAIFDVVDSDMLVDVSVYDHTDAGEEFLGHIDFRAKTDKDSPVRGWFPLKGHADTMAEDTPTGEIYVEALYQPAERKHFGPEDFQILRLIGKGTFGQVYMVRKKDTKRIYAMKVLSKKVIVQKKEVAHTVGERNILVRTALSDSPFIVGLKFSFQTPSDLYLVTDYMSGGELFWHLQKEGRFDEKRAKFYIAELILAIQHLHEANIVYRDLKPENILLDANGHIALCDFGLSKANLTKNDTTNTFCGTTEYLAPEVLLDESGYTKMVDFWSLGVLVFEMCCGWSPFYAEDTQQMYKNIAFGKVRFPRDTLSLEGRNFVKGLLNRNPKHRLGATDDAEELKRHAFFNDIDWDALSKKLITPPFKPKLKNETDVSYFDPEFTNALTTNGSLNERAAALAKGYATSTPLSPSVQANFQGFTFVDDSVLDDHMKDRYTHYEDDEMNDDDHNSQKKNDDWDDLEDVNSRGSNRMSGIVKTNTNDEQMFGSTQFDDV